MRRGAGAEPGAGGHPARERVQVDGQAGLGGFQLLRGATREADPPHEAVDRQRLRADQLGERPAGQPQQDLELERSILALAEADGEGGIRVPRRLDVSDAVPVTPDEDGLARPGQPKSPGDAREPPAEKEAEEPS